MESCHEGTLPLFGSGLFLSLLVESLTPTLNLFLCSLLSLNYTFFYFHKPFVLFLIVDMHENDY